MSKHYVSNWSKGKINAFGDPSFLETAPSQPGVYVIFYKGKGRSVNRLGGKDKNKTVYIGQTKNLRKRLHDFYKDLRRIKKGDKSYNGLHIASCTLKYWYYDSHFKEIFSDLDSLSFKYYRFPKSHNPKIEENILIFKYFSKFADLPPLNYSFPVRWRERSEVLNKYEILFARNGLKY